MPAQDSLISRIAKTLASAPTGGDAGPSGSSILSTAGELYGSRPPLEDQTPPTGFDPAAAALFEAIVEGAFLVANADGDFDATERTAFESVVHNATRQQVDQGQLRALVTDLGTSLKEDGLEKRIQFVARMVEKPEHRAEVLRVAAFLGQISGDVSDVERKTMVDLAAAFSLDAGHVERAIDDARAVLAGA